VSDTKIHGGAIHIADAQHVIEHFRCGIMNGTSPEWMTSAYFPAGASESCGPPCSFNSASQRSASMCVSTSMAPYCAVTVKLNVPIATPFNIIVPVIPALVSYSTLGAGGATTLN
jgi:hypothetical protein